MNTCKTCKWWGLVDSYDNSLKYCKKAEDMGSSEWRGLFSGSNWNDHANRGELTDNCVTGPDFGCVHHEDKEPSDEKP